MKSFNLLAAVALLLCGTSTPLLASPQATRLQVNDQQLDFRGPDRRLQLHDGPAGIVVAASQGLPLRAGEVITAIDGTPVHTVAALLSALRALHGHSTALQVGGRDGRPRTVHLSPMDYVDLLPPAAPLPPPAPAGAP